MAGKHTRLLSRDSLVFRRPLIPNEISRMASTFSTYELWQYLISASLDRILDD